MIYLHVASYRGSIYVQLYKLPQHICIYITYMCICKCICKGSAMERGVHLAVSRRARCLGLSYLIPASYVYHSIL